MANLDQTVADNIMDALNGANSFVAPTSPLKVALVTANGSATADGTEVANAGGSAYARQSVTFSASSGEATSNSGAVTFTNMPTCTVVGIEIWDSSGSPKRIWWGALAASKALTLGDTYVLAIGQITQTLG